VCVLVGRAGDTDPSAELEENERMLTARKQLSLLLQSAADAAPRMHFHRTRITEKAYFSHFFSTFIFLSNLVAIEKVVFHLF